MSAQANSCPYVRFTGKTVISGMHPSYATHTHTQDLSKRLYTSVPEQKFSVVFHVRCDIHVNHHVFVTKPKSGKQTRTLANVRALRPPSVTFQAIFTLSQVTAIISPRHTAYINKKSAPRKVHQTDGVLCPDSFNEVLNNCDFSFVNDLTAKQIFGDSLLGKYRVSYASRDSFFENRCGFSESCLRKEPVPSVVINKKNGIQFSDGFYQKLTNCMRHKNQFTFDVQVRTFKTERSVKSEMQRNPSLFARIKNALGFSMPENLDAKVNVDTTTVTSERFKQIMSQEEGNMSEAERQRVKVAFAEGYLLGNNPKAGKAARYFKVVQQVLTIAIFLAIVVSLMATASGSMFRYVKFCYKNC